MRSRLVLAAVAAGLTVGTVVAATRPEPATPQSTTGALRPITEAPARPPQDRLPDGRYAAGYVHFLARPGSVRLVTTMPDPRGEPDWAIRTYAGERRTIKRPSRTLDDYAYRQAYRCVELGRVMNGRFGWVHGDRRFRPSRPSGQDILAQCTSRARPRETHQHETVIAFTAPSDARLLQGVLWGFAPPGARSVSLLGEPGGPRELDVRDGAYLALIDPSLPRGALRLRFVFGDGRSDITRVDRAPRPDRIPDSGEAVPGTERIEARTPDPAGGQPWGVPVADRRGGGTCVADGPTQAVGDQPGGIDADLGLFTATITPPVQCVGAGLTRRRPLSISYGGGTGVGRVQDPFLARARIERRVLTGRFELVARCHRDVESVTIRSPRDIRTLVPSQRGHVVLAVYDGSFPAGTIVVTAHLRGGGNAVERIPLTFF